MGRPRNHTNRGLPPNLYVRNNGYYCYRDPRTGKEYGLGSDKRDAINQAVEANMQLMAPDTVKLIDRISGENAMTFHSWLVRYEEIVNARGLKKSTLVNYKSWMGIFKASFSDSILSSITTKDIAEFLNTHVNQGKSASAKLMRGALLDLFREAMSEGHINTNPVEATRSPKVEVMRSRLTLENYKIIRCSANDLPPWAGLSMDLALITGQRLGDICKLKWEDIHDDKLWIIQRKTQAKLSIPLSISINGIDLRSVIDKCKSLFGNTDFVLSTNRGGFVAERTMTEGFMNARLLSGIQWDGAPPSFHEIRSLSARLYTDAKGGEFAQHLLGHKSAQMTAKYQDSRGSEWDNITI
ncbi:phage integrase Arm DNA-binding domain-containing protein [Yersinia mollaretii]|uniref:phage integrase Arm DNA-binding domain-containing protein n=1 Tax=Yersinia mollaretii TaxID=33060 RepID=UPI000C15BEA7|nr:phage integrase Arm DNA-binding domain-containing protein [Yersinia mollaretii]MDA5528660.1 phage integrase Arm DNA-binding domain-containing protein [Yersinia mollaretii]MDR7875266.1 phage integrase Arm DNA-binding domain-containing protein [Yersinia mollaretii]PHZ31662.1 integrase [Yersinia mollaretii]WQC73812.1 phage integrase Arm DNA-binding domain-containing protein [Yersinia mollaretii]